MEESLVSLFSTAPYLVSFVAGVLTFLSPCVLPLIPAYLSYISGLSIKQMSGKEGEVSFKSKLKVIKASILFVSGFSLIFILLGASMASLIGNIFNYAWINWVAGGIIIIFGLHIMGIFTIKFLNFEARANFGDTNSNEESVSGFKKFLKEIAPFLLGVSFALGWTPCIGPIFAAIVMTAADEGGTKGLVLMSIYSLGLAIPFLLSAVATSYAISFMNKIKRHFKIIELVAGSLLVLIGIAIATGGLGKLTTIITGG